MYMVHQRTTTAVRDGYGSAAMDEVQRQLAGARQARAWLQGLQIDPQVRAWLVEPVAVVEEALAEIARRRGAPGEAAAGMTPVESEADPGSPAQ